MKAKKASDSALSPDIYDLTMIRPFYWILIVPLLFLLALALNFPLRQTLESLVYQQLQQISPKCPITYSRLRVEYFLPKVVLEQPVFSPQCVSEQNVTELHLENLTLAVNSFSFFPPGPNLKITPQLSKSQLAIYATLSPVKQLIKIEEGKLHISDISNYLGVPQLSGDVTVDMSASLAKIPKDHTMDLALKSQNFELAPLSLQGLQLPQMPIHTLTLKANLQKNTLQINECHIGDAASPVVAQIAGTIIINWGNLAFSQLDLAGEFRFSPNFREKLPFLNLFLKSFSLKDGYYQVKLSGNLLSPKITSK